MLNQELSLYFYSLNVLLAALQVFYNSVGNIAGQNFISHRRAVSESSTDTVFEYLFIRMALQCFPEGLTVIYDKNPISFRKIPKGASIDIRILKGYGAIINTESHPFNISRNFIKRSIVTGPILLPLYWAALAK